MSGKVTGIVLITVDDELLQSNDGASLMFGGPSREAKVGHSVYGYSEKLNAAEIECEIADKAETDIPKFNNFTGATVTFETDTGKRYLVRNAFTSEPCKLTGGDGTISLKLLGDPARQI